LSVSRVGKELRKTLIFIKFRLPWPWLIFKVKGYQSHSSWFRLSMKNSLQVLNFYVKIKVSRAITLSRTIKRTVQTCSVFQLIRVFWYSNFHACRVNRFREDLLTRAFLIKSNNYVKGQRSSVLDSFETPFEMFSTK
jgi:hypothetical protein